MNKVNSNFQYDDLIKIIDYLPVAVGIADLKGNILIINKKSIKLFGYKLNEIPTISDWQYKVFPDPKYRKQAMAAWKNDTQIYLKNKKEIKPKIFSITNKNNKTLQVEISFIITKNIILIIFDDITKRKKTEEALKSSSNFLNDIIEQSPYSIVISDKNGTLIKLNQACCNLLNITPFEVIGKYNVLKDNIVKEQGFLPLVKQVFEKGKTARFELKYDSSKLKYLKLHKTKFLILDVTIFPIKNEAGKITNAVIQHIDITERKLAEQALHESEERYRNQFESNNAIMLIIDPENGSIIDANPAACSFYGWSCDKIKTKNINQINTLTEKEIYHEMQLAHSEKRNHFFFKHKLADGSIKDVEVFSAPIYYKDKKVLYSIVHDITKRKLAEKELCESKERYKELADSINDVFFAMDNNLRYTFWNKASETLTGISSQNALGKYLYDLFPEIKSTKIEKLYKKAIKDKKALNFLNSYKLNGKDYIFEINVYPSKNGISVFTKDITEKKKAEQALQESEERYRELFDHINSGVAVYEVINNGNDFIFKDFNRAGEKIDHDSRDNLIGKSIFDVRPGVEKFGLIEVFKKVWRTGKSVSHPIRFYQDNKLSGWYENFVYKLPSDEIVTVFDNITERKKAEEALHLSEAHYRELFENSPISLWEEDFSEVKKYITKLHNKGVKKFRNYFENHPEDVKICIEKVKIVNVNKSTLEIYKAKNKKELLNNLNNVFSEKSYKTFLEEIVSLTEGNTKFECETITKTLNNEENHIALKLYIVPGYEQSWEKIIISISDITEQKKAENEIKRLNKDLAQRIFMRTAQLETANKELESFTYSVSHDLRAPLRHIHGFINILTEEIGHTLNKENQRLFSIIAKSAEHMGKLIDSLLDFSRMNKNEIHYEVINMNDLVKNIIQDFKPEIQNRNIKWEKHILPNVNGDKTLISQVWQNLISNAIKYTNKTKNTIIEINYKQDSPNEIIFYIRDNGIGFDMNYVNKLFGVFQRLHNLEDYNGIGIGLANVKKIINRHGGNVWAQGKINKGATFYFSLPILQ